MKEAKSQSLQGLNKAVNKRTLIHRVSEFDDTYTLNNFVYESACFAFQTIFQVPKKTFWSRPIPDAFCLVINCYFYLVLNTVLWRTQVLNGLSFFSCACWTVFCSYDGPNNSDCKTLVSQWGSFQPLFPKVWCIFCTTNVCKYKLWKEILVFTICSTFL